MKNSMKRLFLSLAIFSLAFPQALLAQEKISMENSTQVGNVSCADYHPENSVDVLVEADTSKTVPGVTVNFEGSVVNKNTYPIVDGKVVVKVYYRTGEEKGSVVDQFVLPDTFTLPAQAEKKVSFSWHVPENAKGGDYYAATFFTTVSRYQLSGLTFADDMVVNFAGFAVTSAQNGGVFLDDSKTTLNGKAYQFTTESPRFQRGENVEAKVVLTNPFTTESPRFQRGENVEAKVVLTNPSDEGQVIQLTWEEYVWDGEKAENLLRKQFELISVDAKASKELTYVVGPKDTTTYLVVTTKDQYAKSIEGIRFMREGTPEAKFNFSSLLKFPLVKGESNSLFACASASTMASVGGNTLTLTLKDAEQNIIHEYTYQGNLSTDKAGFKDDFIPDDNYSNITLTSTLKRGDEVIDEVTIPYDCNAIDKTLCNESVLAHLSGPKKLGILLVILLSLVALGAIFISQHNSMKRNNRFKVLFFALILGGAGLFGGVGEAQGALVQTQWALSCPGGWTSTQLGDDVKNTIRHLGEEQTQGAEPELCLKADDPAMTITSAWGFGGCPGGTNFTGLYDDAGTWASPDDTPPRHNLNEDNYRPNGSNAYRWCLGISGGGATSISARWHTLFSSVHDPACNVDETYTVSSHLFIHNLNLADYNGANQESLCVKINSSNPPTAPTLTGPIAGFTNTNYPYTTQATDPDGDTLRYGIDWDNDGTPDGWTGYVNSGTSAITNHMWIGVGSYTIKALAEDVNGARSGWSAPLTVVISAPISGICGAAQGWPTTNPPAIGLCTSGNPTPVTPAVAPGPYSWSCTGSSGGSTASCSAPVSGGGGSAVNGTCGSSNGGSFSSAPGSGLCNAGTTSWTDSTAADNTYNWDCNGSGGGTNISCSANKTTNPPAGACGSANGQDAWSAPSSGLCSAGSASAVTGTGPWNWTCTGSTTASCSAPKGPATPSVTLTINGTTVSNNYYGGGVAPTIDVAKGDNLNIVWSSTNTTSCQALSGPGWMTNPKATGGNDNVASTVSGDYTVRCIGAPAASGGNYVAAAKISINIVKKLTVCKNSCNSNVVRGVGGSITSATYTPNQSENWVACYSTSVTCQDTDPSADVTTSTTWGEQSGNTAASLSGTNPKVMTMGAGGNESLTATYNNNVTSSPLNSYYDLQTDYASFNFSTFTYDLKWVAGSGGSGGSVVPKLGGGTTPNWTPTGLGVGIPSSNTALNAASYQSNGVTLVSSNGTYPAYAGSWNTWRLIASTAPYNETATINVGASCTDSGACQRDSRSQSLCAKDSFTVTDACGVTQTCTGAKSCDYNWKEIAP